MASAPDPITSPPDVPGQPYDATEDGSLGKWKSVDPGSGPTDGQMHVSGDFEDGPGPWKQT